LFRRILATVLFIITDFQFIPKNLKVTEGYKIVILLLFSHECEIWSLMLRGEHRLRMNEKMVLSKIFVLEVKEVR